MSSSIPCDDPAALSYAQRKLIEWDEINSREHGYEERRPQRLKSWERRYYDRMLRELVAAGHTRPSMERCLRLPQRSLRVRSRENFVLLRVVHACSWVLRVADSGYDPDVVADVLAHSVRDPLQKRVGPLRSPPAPP